MGDDRRLGSLLLLAVVCAACVHQNDAGVQVNALQADIVFGLKPKQAQVPPAPAQPPAFGPVTPVVQAPADQGQPGFTLPVDLGTLAPSDCPQAAIDAYPSKTAPIQVTTTPSVGEYRWQLGGGTARGISITPISGKQERLVRRVTPIANASTDLPDSLDYTFQVVQPYDTKGSVLVTTYQVRSDNSGQRYVQLPTGSTLKAYVTSPDAGLSVVNEDVVDRAGGVTTIFHPALPFLVLPLPIQPGGQFLSVAADPATGQVTTLQATVLRRARVDACGTIIEGWDVSGLQRTTTSPAVAGTSAPTGLLAAVAPDLAIIDNIYATQYGGMPIAEHSLTGNVAFGTTTVDDVIGQEKPSPLPPGAA